MNRILFFVIIFILSSCAEKPVLESEYWTYDPREYLALNPINEITIDGKLDEESWKLAQWTSDFVDIRGEHYAKPRLQTHAKVLWDSSFLYIGAELIENDIWSTFTERESIIFQENNFEFFIDPDNDTHYYMEYEINSLGTEWDLMLDKPYRDGGPSRTEYDFVGIKSAVHLLGTNNYSMDSDTAWYVEIAVPWASIVEYNLPGKKVPSSGDTWKMNFSRVQWGLEKENESYTKIKGQDNKPLPEDNWVWSPTGQVNMHMPEAWGLVQFQLAPVGSTTTFNNDPTDSVKWMLRELYYAQNAFLETNDRAAISIEELGLTDRLNGIEISTDRKKYVAKYIDKNGVEYTLHSNSKIEIHE